MNLTMSGPIVQVGADDPPAAPPADDGQREKQPPTDRYRPLDRGGSTGPDRTERPDRRVTEPSWPWSWLTPSR